MSLEVGDIVLCTVDKISGTTVFVNIEGEGEGTIVLSEIAPGRIRNLREYVIPKKKIVCKVLRMQGGQVELSLRRVSLKEQKEVKEEYEQEKSYENIFKTILQEKSKEVIEKIKEKYRLHEFIDEIKEDGKKLEEYTDKEKAKKIIEILNSQKKKIFEIKKEFKLSSNAPDGIKKIKDILSQIKEAKVNYLAAGKYSIKTQKENAKSADQELTKILEDVEKKAKENNMEFSVK